MLNSIKNGIGNFRANNREYVNLAPTEKADQSGIYSKALKEATCDPDVSNIALTGPYGSGKSSIIKAFLKSYERFPFFRKRVLQISLAAFLPEADLATGKVSKQEIERSILQQMLYGADANRLPLSRFKRIQSPKAWAPFVSLCILFGLAVCWRLIQQRAAIIDGSYFQPFDQTNWLNLACVAIAFSFVWLIVHQIYIKSFGVSLKSISLKDIQIAPDTAEEESILNRHLDEIIYFFQCTKYDLVIVEDLDRFNNPDVFVTLREINSLINANAGVRQQIRFLYALRDNMFVNTDRTKFFEFIVPVIPIINSSNSIDKVIEQSERLSLVGRLDPQFLREVSRYLSDLRLIQNIFNEYSIYVKNLETDEENILDPNKLLAILIYKNVLPSDFESLHQEKGKLAGILSRHDELIIDAEAGYKTQISELEHQIDEGEKQVPSDLDELRKIYAMALIAKIPHGYVQVGLDRTSMISIQNLVGDPNFNQLLDAKQLHCRNPQNQIQRVDITGFQGQVNSGRTYQERKDEIERKSRSFKDAASNTIKDLREKTSALRFAKFNEIIRLDTKGAEALFDDFGEDRELVRFLIFEGFLDDTYYQYTSLFHSGRLSPSDNKFLIQIRAFTNPEPSFQIDNPEEVIAAMRDDDFRQNYALNTVLVDCILGIPAKHEIQQTKLLAFISSNFDECGDFFSIYYQTGEHTSRLLSLLIKKWPSFIDATLKSSQAIIHTARMLAHLSEKELTYLGKTHPSFSDFVSTRLADILELKVDFDPNRLRLLPLNLQKLNSVHSYPAVAQILIDAQQFKTSIANIDFAYKDVLGLPNAGRLQTKHYSTVLESRNDALIGKVEADFDGYLANVLLELDGNTDENAATIIRVLNRDEVELEQLEKFVQMQTAKVPSLEQIPTRLHSSIFRLNRIEPSWENCLYYVESKDFDAEIFKGFLEVDANKTKLSIATIDGGEDAKTLRQTIFNKVDLTDNSYRTYLKTLPKPFTKFPADADSKKLVILIEEESVSFSKEAFDGLDEALDLQVAFTAKNIEAYLNKRVEFDIDDDFREGLLRSDISDNRKLEIVKDMDLSLIASLSERASIVGALFHRTNAEMADFPSDAALAVVTHLKPLSAQISLLNRCQNLLTNEEVELLLQQMPDPLPEFKPSYRQPRLPDTEANRELVKWLDRRGIISSWKEGIFGGINVYNRRP